MKPNPSLAYKTLMIRHLRYFDRLSTSQAQGPKFALSYRHKFAYGEFMTAEFNNPSVTEFAEAIIIENVR